jgi:hypothetical protein
MGITEEVLAQLKPLFEEADSKGLWFRCTYQNMEFSPDELRAKHKNGELLWGAANWRLFDPQTLFKDPKAAFDVAVEHNASPVKRGVLPLKYCGKF